MFRSLFNHHFSLHLSSSQVLIPLFFLLNFLFNVLGNSSFKLSAQSHNWRAFLLWQVVGNLSGFIAVLTLTGLLRFVPLHIAYPVCMGLAIVGIQIFASHWFFHEPITQLQWLGTVFIVIGILLFARK